MLPKIDHAAIEALPELERAEALRLLAELEAAHRANPLLGYVPHPKQVEFHRVHEKYRCFFGGNRSGKTTAGILDDLVQAIDPNMVPEHLKPYKIHDPPFHCRIITPDFTETLEGVIFEKLLEWTPRSQLVGDSWGKAYDKQRRRLSFKNGSWFSFMTFEQDLDKFGGVALHRVHCDEEPPWQIWKMCRMRLIDHVGSDALFTMTPENGMSWMFDTFYEPWERGQLQDASVVVVDMDDNPHLEEREKRLALEGLSAEERAAKKSGRFVHFAGLVYHEFSRSRHVVPSVPIPEGATVVGSIDPGTRHMAAVVWAYLGYDDDLVVFETVAMKQSTVAQVCKQIRLVEQKHKIRVPYYIIDPAARNVAHQTGRSDQMEYLDNGVITVLGQNAVTAGINRVKERLQTDRLHVMADCETLLDEFRRYRWVTQNRSEHEAKEVVVKKDDHLLDALRYLVMSRPHKPDRPVEEPTLDPFVRAMREERDGRTLRRRRIPRSHEYGAIYS
ncbi:MAG TPA: hypothetical protein VKQ71_08200 [Acidimicrobiales bacterium]|nr:hypothetical protein [Acidimicrobiales bacterium]